MVDRAGVGDCGNSNARCSLDVFGMKRIQVNNLLVMVGNVELRKRLDESWSENPELS